MIRSYLINLDQDSERLAFIKSSFDRLAIPFERIPAVDGRKFSDAAYAEFQRHRPRDGRTWLRGQMGCFLSHHAAWQKIAEGDTRFGAVFEDDIHVSADLKHILADDAWIPENVNLIRLDTSTSRVRLTAEPVVTVKHRKVYGVRSTSWCTGGYLLSRQTAQQLVAVAPRYHDTSDEFLYNFEGSIVASKLNILQFYPALCTQEKHLAAGNARFSSNIELETAERARARLKERLDKLRPMSVLRALYRSVSGYKRIGFQ